MNIAVGFIFTMLFTTGAIMTFGGDMMGAFDSTTESWIAMQSRIEERADTRVTGPTGLSVSATSTVALTMVNEGDVTLGRFADWDVIFEIQENPGIDFAYLTYTTNATPAANEWTVQGIFLNAASSIAEIVDPGVFNPGEEMVILANPSPSVTANTVDRATIVTPNGVTTTVIFQIDP